MRRLGAYTCTLAVIALLATSATCHAEKLVNIDFGLMPLGLGIAPDQGGFTAERYGDPYSYRDEIGDDVHLAPELFFGIDIRTPASGVGINAFGCRIEHSGFSGNLIGGEIAYILPHPDNTGFLQRLKVGAFNVSLDWEADHTEVVFEDTSGFQAGYAFDAGRTFAFHLEVLYREMEFDANGVGSTETSSSTLDLSGVVVNVGMRWNIPVGKGE